GELARYVGKKYGASAYRSSEVLRDILKRMHLPETRENVQKVSMMIRKFFGEDIISKINLEDTQKSQKHIVAIDGLRRKEDFKYFRKKFDFRVIYIESDIKKRFARIAKRAENQGDRGKNFPEFKRDHKRETETKIKELKRSADYVVENNGTLREFQTKIDKIMEDIINNK
ncbi:MAG: AAA family ATPase, partial [Patescibacteria group bacterium]